MILKLGYVEKDISSMIKFDAIVSHYSLNHFGYFRDIDLSRYISYLQYLSTEFKNIFIVLTTRIRRCGVVDEVICKQIYQPIRHTFIIYLTLYPQTVLSMIWFIRNIIEWILVYVHISSYRGIITPKYSSYTISNFPKNRYKTSDSSAKGAIRDTIFSKK